MLKKITLPHKSSSLTTEVVHSEVTENKKGAPRVYIKIVGDFYSIYHYTTHAILEFANNIDDMIVKLDTWLEMPIEDLYRFLIKTKAKIPKEYELSISRSTHDKEMQEFLDKAWYPMTLRFFEEHKFTQVYEEIPYEFIKKEYEKIQHEWNLIDKSAKIEKEKMAKEKLMKKKGIVITRPPKIIKTVKPILAQPLIIPVKQVTPQQDTNTIPVFKKILPKKISLV